MENDLGNYRKSYERNPLIKGNVPENPMELFQHWFYDADETDGIEEANVMSISTLGLDGFPKNTNRFAQKIYLGRIYFLHELQ